MDKKVLLEKHKDIARIDQESKGTHGWYVRVRFLGVTKSKFFSDKKWGGRFSSLQAAISWRDETEKAWGKPRTDRNMVMVTHVSTGVVGVRLNDKNPSMWLGQDGETQAAIPDALFKVVIKQNGSGVEALAFLIPNILRESEKDPGKYLVSVDRIESLTGLDFLTALPVDVQAKVESKSPKAIDW